MRRLIVCADGTWNRPDQRSGGVEAPTNVVKLARAIAPVDSRGVSQIVYYEPGVGTHDAGDKVFGGAFGNQKRGVNTWEYVHESAQLRLTETATLPAAYRPTNLAAYLGRPQPLPIVASALRSTSATA